MGCPLPYRKTSKVADYYSIVSDYRIECADLIEENRRIARHLVRDGILHAHEREFEPLRARASEGSENLPKPHGSIPHFCNDCAHQGATIIRPKESFPKPVPRLRPTDEQARQSESDQAFWSRFYDRLLASQVEVPGL